MWGVVVVLHAKQAGTARDLQRRQEEALGLRNTGIWKEQAYSLIVLRHLTTSRGVNGLCKSVCHENPLYTGEVNKVRDDNSGKVCKLLPFTPRQADDYSTKISSTTSRLSKRRKGPIWGRLLSWFLAHFGSMYTPNLRWKSTQKHRHSPENRDNVPGAEAIHPALKTSLPGEVYHPTSLGIARYVCFTINKELTSAAFRPSAGRYWRLRQHDVPATSFAAYQDIPISDTARTLHTITGVVEGRAFSEIVRSNRSLSICFPCSCICVTARNCSVQRAAVYVLCLPMTSATQGCPCGQEPQHMEPRLV